MCCLYIHLNKCFGRVLSKYWFGYRERYNAQQCLLTIIEKSSASLDQNRTSTELLTDLSKAFDCLTHDLIIAKLHAYGCDLLSLKLINSYLRNMHQRVKINNFYSSWAAILFGVSQGCRQIHVIKQNSFLLRNVLQWILCEYLTKPSKFVFCVNGVLAIKSKHF